jgi:hypothetical protein
MSKLIYKIAGEYFTEAAAKSYTMGLPEPIMVGCVSKGRTIEERSDSVWGVPDLKVTKVYKGSQLVAAYYNDVTIINTMDMVQICHPDWTLSNTMREWCFDVRESDQTETELMQGFAFDIAQQLFPKAKGYVKGGAR